MISELLPTANVFDFHGLRPVIGSTGSFMEFKAFFVFTQILGSHFDLFWLAGHSIFAFTSKCKFVGISVKTTA